MSLRRHLGRAAGILATGALSVTLLTSSSPRVRADEDSAPGQKSEALRNPNIDIVLKEARIQEAIQFIEKSTGINLVFTNPSFQYNHITLTLTNKPVDVVLRQIALAAGADFWQDGGIYYIGPRGTAPKAPEPIGPILPDPTPTVARHFEKIKLMYTEPHAILAQLGVRNGSALEDYEEIFRNNVIRSILQTDGNSGAHTILPGVTPKVVGPTDGSSTSVAPFINVGQSRDAGAQQANPRSAGVIGSPFGSVDQNAHRDGFEGQSGLGADNTIVQRAGQFPGSGGAIGGLQQPGGSPGAPGAAGAGGQANQNASATGLLPTGIQPGDLIALDADNSILVRTDDPNAFRDLREIIRLLDVKPRQIMIRAEFVTVLSNGTNGFGINWAFQKVNLIGAANLGVSSNPTAFLQFASGNLQTQLSFILSSGQGRLVAAPFATTLNNTPIEFTQIQNAASFTQVVAGGAGGQVFSSTQITLSQVGQAISILPRINGDETITLFGTVRSASLGTPFTGPNGDSFPNVTTQTAPVKRIIRNGDTMVIAGLTSKNDTLSVSKVPLLGDLPLIGTLFRSRNTATTDSELLVFITPTIIQERPANNVIGGGAGGGLTIPGGGAAGPGGAGGGVTPGGAP